MAAQARKLYTTGDVARRLGRTRQHALNVVNDRRREFPPPFDTLPGGMQVWLIEDVERWIKEHPDEVVAEEPES